MKKETGNIQCLSKYSMALLVNIFGVFSSALYGSYEPINLVSEESIGRLIEAAWQDPPSSLEAVICTHILQAQKSEKEIYDHYEKILQQYRNKNPYAAESDPNLYRQTLQRNVERHLLEQKMGRWVRERIRIDGKFRRIDQEIFFPRSDFSSDSPCQTRLTEAERNDEKYEMTFLFDNLKEYRYQHNPQTVTLINHKIPPKQHEVQEFLCPFRILQPFLGSFQGLTESGEILYIPDSEKIQRLRKTGFLDADRQIIITPDPNKAEHNICLTIKKNDKPELMLVCNNNYTLVLEWRVYSPITHHPMLEEFFLRYDENNLPRQIMRIEYDESGNFRKKKRITIDHIHIHPIFSPEIFRFIVPEGYEVVEMDAEKAEKQNEEKRAEYEKAKEILNSRDIAQIKPLLAHSLRSVRFEAFSFLIASLRNNPNQLMQIAHQMKDDPYRKIQELALDVLKENKINNAPNEHLPHPSVK